MSASFRDLQSTYYRGLTGMALALVDGCSKLGLLVLIDLDGVAKSDLELVSGEIVHVDERCLGVVDVVVGCRT